MALSKLTPATSTSIELFRSYPVGIGIESVSYEECRQTGNVALSNQLDIELKSSGRQMINLDQSTLNIRFRVEGEDEAEVTPVVMGQDGNVQTPAVPVSIINNIVHSMWEGVELSMNNKNIYTSRAHAFSHKNHLKILRMLEYGNTTKQEQMFILDYPPHFTKTLKIRGGNQGLKRRHNEILNRKSVHVCGPIGLGVAEMGTLLPPGIVGKLTLIKASDDYLILTDNLAQAREFKIIIEDVWVKLCLVTIPDQVYDGMMATLAKTPAVYLYQESEVKEICFMANNRLPTEQEIVSGLLPFEVVILFVTQVSHQGSRTTNPLALEVIYIYLLTFVHMNFSPPS